MAHGFNPRWIKGKTVTSVSMTPRSDGRAHGSVYHQPEITFSDGSSITFITEETEVGEYGTDIVYHPVRKKGA